MNPALWVAKTGLDAQQIRLQVVSNNLANASTTWFKKDRANFEDLIYQNVRQPGGQATQDTTLPTGLMLGTGVRVAATQKMHHQGNVIQTENSLDLAIQGDGYFQVLRPNGDISYTRDGSFQVDEQGRMVTSDGMLLEPAITLPEQTISVVIGRDGTVSALEPGNTAPTNVGTIETASFVNPAGLMPIGDNQFLETVASGAPIAGIPGEENRGSLHDLPQSNGSRAKKIFTLGPCGRFKDS